MNIALLSIAIFVAFLSIIANGSAIYMLWTQRPAFKAMTAYMDRIMKYADGLADIHAALKETIKAHNNASEDFITEAKKEIMDQIGYTLRWSEVISKLIRVSDLSPDTECPNATDPLKKAEQMHEIGLKVAEIAFDEKADLEKEKAEEIKEELATAKEELASSEAQAKPT